MTDVVLSQGVLVVSYSNKSVKLYSFEHIVQRVGILKGIVERLFNQISNIFGKMISM